MFGGDGNYGTVAGLGVLGGGVLCYKRWYLCNTPGFLDELITLLSWLALANRAGSCVVMCGIGFLVCVELQYDNAEITSFLTSNAPTDGRRTRRIRDIKSPPPGCTTSSWGVTGLLLPFCWSWHSNFSHCISLVLNSFTLHSTRYCARHAPK